VADWAAQWRKTHLVAASTQAKYDHYLDKHIIPAFGQLSLDQIRRSAVKEWAIDLRARYSAATVRGIVTLMSLLLTAAVEERMIAINPIQGLRMAMRWGEITGLAQTNCHLERLCRRIDPETGSLHEVAGRMWLGPPETDAAARRIDLPPFLATLLREVMNGHDHQQVFITADGHWHRRSNFARRLWRPACDGDPDRGWPPIVSGAVFHGLRHHHKTVLDEPGFEDALKYERMGHHMPGIAGVYSHVTDPMRQNLRIRLQQRWTDLTGDQPRP
jgi:hypothetical protein